MKSMMSLIVVLASAFVTTHAVAQTLDATQKVRLKQEIDYIGSLYGSAKSVERVSLRLESSSGDRNGPNETGHGAKYAPSTRRSCWSDQVYERLSCVFFFLLNRKSDIAFSS